MKSLYITSVEPHSGKTAACLALGKRLQADGFCVKYMKPMSLQPYRVAGKVADEDAAFAKEVLQLAEEAWELSPVVVTTDVLRRQLTEGAEADLMTKVKVEAERLISGCDVMLLEGGGSLREGYVMGLPTLTVAESLGSTVLVIVRFHSEVQLLDDVLAAKARLGLRLGGVMINRVPEEALHFVEDIARSFIEGQGIPVLGVLPEAKALVALTVQEVIESLGAEVLTNVVNPTGMVETLMVGAMSAEAALSRFRKVVNKAVITGGDRADIQLAALETSTTCLVLTGNMRPSPLILKQADAVGVPVLLVRENTLEAIEKIERIFGKTRLGQAAKLAQYEKLLAEKVDFKRLYHALGISK